MMQPGFATKFAAEATGLATSMVKMGGAAMVPVAGLVGLALFKRTFWDAPASPAQVRQRSAYSSFKPGG